MAGAAGWGGPTEPSRRPSGVRNAVTTAQEHTPCKIFGSYLTGSAAITAHRQRFILNCALLGPDNVAVRRSCIESPKLTVCVNSAALPGFRIIARDS
jgi:hypothetical protein